ncbi:MAG: alpha/beta hydrolase, partial [Streptococcus salivarius]
MKKKTLIFSLLATLGLVCVGGWYFISQNQTQAVKAEARKTFIQSSRPTIFFHGWGSSSRAERHMANAAKDAGVTKTIIDAKVDKDGQVTLDGSIPKDAINPIVLVNFDNNRGASTQE